MSQLVNFNVHSASTNVQVLVSSILVIDFVAIWRAFLYENSQGVNTVNEFLLPANVACGCDNLTFAFALLALLLELLDKAWSNLLFFYDDSLAITFVALFDIFWVVATASSAVRTDDLPVV